MFLVDQGRAIVRREGERFVAYQGASCIVEARAGDVDTIVLSGRVEITRAALDLAVTRGIPVCFQSSTGRYRGTLLPAVYRGSQRRRCQYGVLSDEQLRTELGRHVLLAQLANQCALVRRLGLRREDERLADCLRELRGLRDSVRTARTTETLRGLEGTASRIVFRAVRHSVDASLGFTLRAVRSGVDPLNAVLDVLGGLLSSTCISAVAAARLDPYFGAMHGSSRDGPALALDLEDVFRPLLVTATAVKLFSKNMLRQSDFVIDPSGRCQLEGAALRRVCEVYGRSLHRSVTRQGDASPRSYLGQINEDARRMGVWFERPRRPIVFFTTK